MEAHFMKRFIFSGLSVLITAAAIVPAVQAQTIEARSKNTPSLAGYETVHQLVNAQRDIRGTAKNTPSLEQFDTLTELVNSQRDQRGKN
jgi:hypothetical protein